MTPCLAAGSGIVAFTNARLETVSKAGVIEQGTVLVTNGKISAVGKEVEIPVSAKVVDMQGKTLMPGIVDPYYVVEIGRNVQASAPRTIVFRGRVFVIGGGTPAIATSFAKVKDGIDYRKIDWDRARRSGITSMHLVTRGYAQSLLAQQAESLPKQLEDDGKLLVAITNQTKSLNVLRAGLIPKKPSGSSSSRSSASASSASRPTSSSSSSSSGTTSKWESVRQGKEAVFVNVNNSAALLHLDKISTQGEKSKIAVVATGASVFQTLEAMEHENYVYILPPTIDLIPNSAVRINVPKMLKEEKKSFVFSLSLGQSDFREQQHTPLFGLGMLVKSGLDRETALAACTIEPAKLLGIEKQVGSLEKGKMANMLVFSEDPLSVTAEVEQVIVEGSSVYETE